MTGQKRNSIHKVKNYELNKLDVVEQFYSIRLVAEGWYSKVYSAMHVKSDEPIALKCINKEATKKKDFFKEVHYNYYLSPHPNIVNSYEYTYDSATAYIFAQEFTPEGDLSLYIRKGGLGEDLAKQMGRQITSALEFMHSMDLVHRDIRLENVLVFDSDLTKVKLADFGLTQKVGSLVKRNNVRVAWAPPEVCKAVYNEGYYVEASLDSWQLGIFLFVILTGSYPWYAADITDPHYKAWLAFLKRKTTKVPRRFRCFTPRFLRLLKRLLEPKAEKRGKVAEVYKYLEDDWIEKGAALQDLMFDESSSEIYFTSSRRTNESTDKVKLVEILNSYGVPTTVDKHERTKRITEWLRNSVYTSERDL